ncbi:hypothetical protein [Nocardiopsis lucentensis]|uniref:hypothetical protein n=1 Tax=Nocardiopsis lucentensis TaxID=53441 RepID=UPI00034A1394|nr:hypothetical protein [Nocardiopsis lucentensis]
MPDDSLEGLRRTIEVGLAQVSGRLDVILQRLEHQAARTDEHARRLEELDARLDDVERVTVTREDMDTRATRTIAVTAVVVTGIGIVVGAVTAVAVAALT